MEVLIRRHLARDLFSRRVRKVSTIDATYSWFRVFRLTVFPLIIRGFYSELLWAPYFFNDWHESCLLNVRSARDINERYSRMFCGNPVF